MIYAVSCDQFPICPSFAQNLSMSDLAIWP